ncbi:hypothetical protein EB74_08650 [Mycobacterium sp. SWH-M5]|nr:hypothetical protein EB74_08650 [Mycobacterium sp. SWH-M5]
MHIATLSYAIDQLERLDTRDWTTQDENEFLQTLLTIIRRHPPTTATQRSTAIALAATTAVPHRRTPPTSAATPVCPDCGYTGPMLTGGDLTHTVQAASTRTA